MAEVVECYNSFTKRRRDLFGCVDIVAVDRTDGGVIFVQSTSAAHMKDRAEKIIPELRALSDKLTLYVIGWKKLKKKNSRGLLWVPRVLRIQPEEDIVVEGW
jgi:hypothetical protein